MQVDVTAAHHYFCPQCLAFDTYEGLKRHYWLHHGSSLVGVALETASVAFDMTFKAGGLTYVYDVFEPYVYDVGLHREP